MFRLTTGIAAIALCALQLVLAAPVSAETPKPIGSYGDWQALTYQENGKPVCYVFTEPAKKEGQYTSRGQVYALVTHRPADKKLNVFTIISGYTYKEDSDAILEIGDQKFTLFTQEGMAWANDEDDPKIAEALKKGTGMVVHGTSARGTETIDTYSLKGFSKAYDAIGDACGLNLTQ
jgi:invasion protein IalB